MKRILRVSPLKNYKFDVPLKFIHNRFYLINLLLNRYMKGCKTDWSVSMHVQHRLKADL